VAKPNGNNLKLAMQRQGRLTEETTDLLHSVGLAFESGKEKLFTTCRNFPLEILFGRDDDIPEYVEEGIVDLGIVGRNLIFEEDPKVEELLELGYGYCSVIVAVPKDSPMKTPADLAGKKIATSYPNSARKYFGEKGIPVEIVHLSGSVEIAPGLGIASGIVEITATGSSLRLNELRSIDTVLKSEALLVANCDSMKNPDKEPEIQRLLTRLKGALLAQQYKYIMMNAPESALPDIQAIVPGLKCPTVVPLALKGWVGVHTVVKEDVFWEVIEALKAVGASEILVSPIEKMIV
jgi:ATP phosphoribosyltransferase